MFVCVVYFLGGWGWLFIEITIVGKEILVYNWILSDQIASPHSRLFYKNQQEICIDP